MDVSLKKDALKQFSRLVGCLAKIGHSELTLEILPTNLIFRTLNSAHSAFVAATVKSNFFNTWKTTHEEGDEQPKRFKLNIKAFATVFKGVTAILSCIMRLTPGEDPARFYIELTGKLASKKTFKLNYEEIYETTQALYNTEHQPTVIAKPKPLLDLINKFHTGLAEVSFLFRFQTQDLIIKSYLDEEKRNSQKKNLLFTEVKLQLSDFESFVATEELSAGEIIFRLKELKAILGFCEVIGQDVYFYSEGAGKPILFTVNYFDKFNVDFVLATLVDPAKDESESSPSNSQQASSSNKRGNSSEIHSSTSTPSGSQMKHSPSAAPSAQDRDSTTDASRSNSQTSSAGPSRAAVKEERGSISSNANPEGMDVDGNAAEHESSEEEIVEATPPSSPPSKRQKTH